MKTIEIYYCKNIYHEKKNISNTMGLIPKSIKEIKQTNIL